MNRQVKTIGELVAQNAREYPDLAFLNFYDDIVTYRELDRKSDAVAAYLLANGIRKGDVVSFMIGNCPSFFYVLLGAQKIGAVAGPINNWWQADEVEYLVNDCKPAVLVMDPQFAPIVSAIRDRIPSVKRIIVNATEPMTLDFLFERLPEILVRETALADFEYPSAGDMASLMYTSGTTGKPKGVVLTHKGIVTASRMKTEHVHLNPGEKTLCTLPLFFSGGLNDVAYPCMYVPATIVLRKNFSASEFWNCVEKYQIDAFYIVPTMWNILLKSPEASQVDTRSLKFGLSGAAPIPPEQLAECERRFKIPILEAYGQTENTGGITSNQLDNRKHGSIGTIFKGLELKIVDPDGTVLGPNEVGEILIKGETVMQEYLNKPEETAKALKDGWLCTGDVGYQDADGFLFIVDRKKDLIIRGGVNIFPKEIENVLLSHPGVDQAAVIPGSHEKYGQVPIACIVQRRGENLTVEDLAAFCKEKMAPYKLPEKIIFRASLPTNAVGKVLKQDLMQILEQEAAAPAVPVAHFFEGMTSRFIPEKARGVNAAVSYFITGKGGGQWTVQIDDGRMTLTPEIAESPRVYIVTSDAAYHDIATGKLDGITAVLTGKMKIEGDINFMAEFRQMFTPLSGNG